MDHSVPWSTPPPFRLNGNNEKKLKIFFAFLDEGLDHLWLIHWHRLLPMEWKFLFIFYFSSLMASQSVPAGWGWGPYRGSSRCTYRYSLTTTHSVSLRTGPHISRSDSVTLVTLVMQVRFSTRDISLENRFLGLPSKVGKLLSLWI